MVSGGEPQERATRWHRDRFAWDVTIGASRWLHGNPGCTSYQLLAGLQLKSDTIC
jgi:hypothetical protein